MENTMGMGKRSIEGYNEKMRTRLAQGKLLDQFVEIIGRYNSRSPSDSSKMIADT